MIEGGNMSQQEKKGTVAEPLIPKHGGYRKLKSFQLAQLVYDVTVRFCERYISKFSRTRDQMVQAARSGVQNIAEGSQASGTSKKTELKLTNVARASLEELKLDYEDYLRQRGLKVWAQDEPLRKALVQRRCTTADEVAEWVQEVRNGQRELNGQGGQCGQDEHSSLVKPRGESIPSISPSMSTPSKEPSTTPSKALCYSGIAANAALVLIGVACSMLDRQIKAQADAFTQEGGFTERLYRVRKNSQKK